MEVLEGRDVPAVIYTDTFDWNGVAEVTVTVTDDEPGHEGDYFWNYNLTNLTVTTGIMTFALPVEDSSMVSSLGSSVGWTGSIGTFMGDPDLVAWQSDSLGLGVNASADFWFVTEVADPALTNGVISDLGTMTATMTPLPLPPLGPPPPPPPPAPMLNSLPAGFVAAPIPAGAGLPGAPLPAILVTTALDKDTPNAGLTSLREAIRWVNEQELPNDQLQVRFSSGIAGTPGSPNPIVLGDLEQLPEIMSNIFINGTGRHMMIVRDVEKGSFRLLKGHSISTIEIAGLTLGSPLNQGGQGWAGGSASGGAIYTNGNLTLRGCTVQDNRGFLAGAIYSSTGPQGFLTIDNCTIQNNIASEGGGIHIRGGTLTITDSIIFHNDATGVVGGNLGGGIFIGADVVEVDITDTTIRENTAGQFGGGIFVAGGREGTVFTDVTLSNVWLYQNTAVSRGGGVSVGDGNSSLLRLQGGTVIQGNTTTNASGKGGGVFLGSGTLVTANMYFLDNTASIGGGLYLVTGSSWGGDDETTYFLNNLSDDYNGGD